MENNRPDHAVSTNIKKTNKVNSIVDNEMKFDSINSLDNNPVKELPQIVNIRHIGGKNSIQSIILGLTCLWENGYTYRMINLDNINPYKSKLRSTKVYYSTVAGSYKTTHDMKVPISMPDFSSRKIKKIPHWQHTRWFWDRLWHDHILWHNGKISTEAPLWTPNKIMGQDFNNYEWVRQFARQTWSN